MRVSSLFGPKVRDDENTETYGVIERSGAKGVEITSSLALRDGIIPNTFRVSTGWFLQV